MWPLTFELCLIRQKVNNQSASPSEHLFPLCRVFPERVQQSFSCSSLDSLTQSPSLRISQLVKTPLPNEPPPDLGVVLFWHGGLMSALRASCQHMEGPAGASWMRTETPQEELDSLQMKTSRQNKNTQTVSWNGLYFHFIWFSLYILLSSLILFFFYQHCASSFCFTVCFIILFVVFCGLVYLLHHIYYDL